MVSYCTFNLHILELELLILLPLPPLLPLIPTPWGPRVPLLPLPPLLPPNPHWRGGPEFPLLCPNRQIRCLTA